ncbi:MAG TPA: TIGR03435 family protein [Bryobacteraceae bacterium]|nr:TIGR03435 family protein [Bryobacteraceae bacterium]
MTRMWRRIISRSVWIDFSLTTNARKATLFAAASVLTASVPVVVGTLRAQTPISYAASVKPNNSPEPRALTEYFPGGRFSATAVTVRSLLRLAYRIQDYQLVGAPAWSSTKRYDIAAKVEDNPPPLQVLLRTLLVERFKLAVHNETRQLPVFALVLAKGDGRLGPHLLKSDFDCAAYAAAAHALPDPARTPACGARVNVGALSGKSITMAQFTTGLAAFVDRFAFDKTGLVGRFDVELTWTPEQVSSNLAATASPDAARGDSGGPSIFTALQEQLGLKLVPERGPVDVLVVDHVEEPAPE